MTPTENNLRLRTQPDRAHPPGTFNRLYGVKLPKYKNVDKTTPTFWAVRADADRDGNQFIGLSEVAEAVKYSGFPAYFGQLTYSALGRVKTISQPPGATFPIDPLGVIRAKLIQDSEYPLGSFQLNDLLVSYASAIYPPFVQTLDDAFTHYDHGSITRTKIASLLYARPKVIPSRK
ncbi:MAG: hypothetical protein V1899_10355 [Planctomycetota bacterium]